MGKPIRRSTTQTPQSHPPTRQPPMRQMRQHPTPGSRPHPQRRTRRHTPPRQPPDSLRRLSPREITRGGPPGSSYEAGPPETASSAAPWCTMSCRGVGEDSRSVTAGAPRSIGSRRLYGFQDLPWLAWYARSGCCVAVCWTYVRWGLFSYLVALWALKWLAYFYIVYL